MKQFDKLYKSLLMEMPHVSFELPSGKHVDIDLELEFVESLDELKSLFERILSGEEIVTHKGYSYALTTHEEHMAFMNEIKDFLSYYLKHKFNLSLQEFLDSLS
jgi:hypothetical protein